MIRRKITRTIAEGNRHHKNILASSLLRTLTRLINVNNYTMRIEVNIIFSPLTFRFKVDL